MTGSILSRLSSEWRVLADPTRGTVVLLHPRGLWVEVDTPSALREGPLPDVGFLCDSLTHAAERMTGRAEVIVDQAYGLLIGVVVRRHPDAGSTPPLKVRGECVYLRGP